MKIITYLNFAGNCEEAMKFYAETFQGEIGYIMRYKDGPENFDVPKNYEEKILHGTLSIGEATIYFSDLAPGKEVKWGNHSLSMLMIDTEEELERIYKALKEKARAIQFELADTFWGARYAELTDKYGVNWGLHFDKE